MKQVLDRETYQEVFRINRDLQDLEIGRESGPTSGDEIGA